MSNKLNQLREEILEQWKRIVSLGGEWNEGYVQGLDFALDAIDDLILEEKLKRNVQNRESSHSNFFSNNANERLDFKSFWNYNPKDMPSWTEYVKKWLDEKKDNDND